MIPIIKDFDDKKITFGLMPHHYPKKHRQSSNYRARPSFSSDKKNNMHQNLKPHQNRDGYTVRLS